jgi:hypothetical protein
MPRFWRQALLIGSITAYAAACIIIVAFADAPSPSSAIPHVVELPPASSLTAEAANLPETADAQQRRR